MPEENKKEEKTVDIDASGPDTEVDIPEEKEEAVQPIEEKVEEKQEPVEEKQEPVEEKKVEEKPEQKQELEQYSEGVQKRIAKLTKKWREAERQKEAALDYAKGVQREHLDVKTRMAKLEPSYVTAMENRVVSGLEAAKAKLAAAREASDINAEVEAQKEIAKLGIEEARVAAFKTRVEETREREVKTPTLNQAIGQPPAPDPKAESWAEKNEWFGKDNAMTYTAFDYHKKLTEQEGFDPNSDEYYTEIDKRMRLDFPHKFAKTESTESTKPTQTVASATRSVRPSR